MKFLAAFVFLVLSFGFSASRAEASCWWVFGDDLCAESCRGDKDQITPELVKAASGDEQVCALSIAASTDVLELLFANGTNINAKTESAYKHAPAGRNALYRVIEDGRMDLFNSLLSHGIEVNVQDRWGTSPLMDAVMYNSPEMVKKLLAQGALPNLEDIFGKTALCLAQEGFFLQPTDPKIISELEKAGAVCAH